MKKLLLAAVALLATASYAQCPPSGSLYFTSQAQIDDFLVQYPNCTEVQRLHVQSLSDTDPVTNLYAFQNITAVTDYIMLNDNQQLTSLSGLNALTTVGGNVSITGPITSLSGLDNITAIGGGLVLYGTDIQDVDGLASLTSVEGELNLQGYYLQSLAGLSNLTTLNGALFVSNSPLLTSLHGLEGLTSVHSNGIEGLDEAIDIIQMAGLTSLQGLENITSVNNGSIYIVDNPLLTDVSALASIAPSSVVGLTITDNLSLPVCSYPNICSYLENEEAVFTAANNAANCTDTAAVIAACHGAFNRITGTVTFDYENSGCITGALSLGNRKVTATDSLAIQHIVYTNDEGVYNFFLEDGTYTVDVEITEPGFSVSATAVPVIFNGSNPTVVVPFCVTATQENSGIKVSFYPLDPLYPGSYGTYKMVCENMGPTIQSGTITLHYLMDKVEFVDAVIPPDTSTTDSYPVWEYSNLSPLNAKEYLLTFYVRPEPESNIGDFITYTVTATAEDDTDEIDNTVTVNLLLTDSNMITANKILSETATPAAYKTDADIYPNPAQSVIHFASASASAITEVILYNSLGQEVVKTTATAVLSVNVANLANGIYLCQIKNTFGDMTVKKIIISK